MPAVPSGRDRAIAALTWFTVFIETMHVAQHAHYGVNPLWVSDPRMPLGMRYLDTLMEVVPA